MPVSLGYLGQGSLGTQQGIGMAGLGLLTSLRDSEAANSSCGLCQPKSHSSGCSSAYPGQPPGRGVCRAPSSRPIPFPVVTSPPSPPRIHGNGRDSPTCFLLPHLCSGKIL